MLIDQQRLDPQPQALLENSQQQGDVFPFADADSDQICEVALSHMSPAALGPDVEEYVRLAGELSEYITWDMLDVPGWSNFGQ